jgi:pyruvate dehydrogenase E2 component (dihydrolipoamide acetyltransferase)
MAVAVIMPRQGQSVETCILGQWYKSTGDPVKTGDILFSYETDKAAFDEEAKTDGVLLARFYEEGDEVPVLADVAVIGVAGEDISAFSGANEPAEVPVSEAVPALSGGVPLETVVGESTGTRMRISPLARKMASGMGVDFTQIQGTGPMGRIISRDIEAWAAESKTAKTAASSPRVEATPTAASIVSVPKETPVFSSGEDFQVKPLSNMRKLIARAMHQSLQNSAQLTHHLGADARALLAARKKFKKEFEAGNISENVTVNDLVCFAVIRALKKFPQVNTHLLGDQLKFFRKVNLGLAVDTDRGLMVPALRNADDLSVTGLSNQLRALAGDCRRGNINPDLLSPEAATFTVSNLGNYGVEMFTPVINLPQTAILGVCTITPRPKDLGDGVYAFVPVIGLSLTYDHRALDGGEATRFLAGIASEIENIQF